MKIKYEASKEIFKYYNELTVISQRLKKIEKGSNIIIVNQIIRCILCIFAFTFYIFIVGRIEPTIFINDINMTKTYPRHIILRISASSTYIMNSLRNCFLIVFL